MFRKETVVQRRTAQSDLLPEVLGKVYWEEGLGYRLDVEFEAQNYAKVFDVGILSTTTWYLLERNERRLQNKRLGKESQRTNTELGIGRRHHPKNPKNLVLAVAPKLPETS